MEKSEIGSITAIVVNSTYINDSFVGLESTTVDILANVTLTEVHISQYLMFAENSYLGELINICLIDCIIDNGSLIYSINSTLVEIENLKFENTSVLQVMVLIDSELGTVSNIIIADVTMINVFEIIGGTIDEITEMFFNNATILESIIKYQWHII